MHVLKIHLRCLCFHVHPDIPSASKMTETLRSIGVASMSLGSRMDLNITHSCACPNRWSFSHWPRLWLEGSHRRVGKLDRRWGASDRGRKREGETAVLMTTGAMLCWVRLSQTGVSSPALKLDSSGHGGFLMLGGGTWRGHSPDLSEMTCLQDIWDGLGELAGSGSSSSRWHCCPEQQTSVVCHPASMNSSHCRGSSWTAGV